MGTWTVVRFWLPGGGGSAFWAFPGFGKGDPGTEASLGCLSGGVSIADALGGAHDPPVRPAVTALLCHHAAFAAFVVVLLSVGRSPFSCCFCVARVCTCVSLNINLLIHQYVVCFIKHSY